jgi:hypothetical protein
MVDALIIQQNGIMMRIAENVKNLSLADVMETKTISTISGLVKMLAYEMMIERLKLVLNPTALSPLDHDL